MSISFATRWAITTTPVDINTAPLERIVLLRGIGPRTAARIVAARPFNAPQELVTRTIIPEPVFDKIANELTASLGHACFPGATHREARSGRNAFQR